MTPTTLEAAPKSMPAVDAKAFDERISPFVARAKAAQVTTVEEDDAAKKEFQAGTALKKFIEGVYEKPKQTLFQAHKDMVAQEKTALAPVIEGLKIYETKCIAFKQAQEKKAKEVADALAALAKKDAEELQLREALSAEAAGDKQLANEILSEAPMRASIAVEPALAKVDGVGVRKTWSAEVTDLKALVKFVASRCDEDPGVLCYLEAAMPVLNREAVNKKDLLRIPGVKSNSKEGMSGRSAFRSV